jgi:hypothetical protein
MLAYTPNNLPISAAGQMLGLGDLLKQDVESEADRLRRLRQSQAKGRPDLAGAAAGIGYPGALGPASSLAGRLR